MINKDERMRMIDITQSYNIFDSTNFKTTKLVQDKIENNPEYDLTQKNPIQIQIDQV